MVISSANLAGLRFNSTLETFELLTQITRYQLASPTFALNRLWIAQIV